jgi:multiple sugar transport system substrate-binding protein
MNWKKASVYAIALTFLLGAAPLAPNPAQAQTQRVTLQFWAHWLSQQRRPTVDKIISWNARNPNIQVEYTGVPFDQIINKTLAAVAASNPPDVVAIDIRTTRFRAAKNQILSLSDLGADKIKDLYFPNLYRHLPGQTIRPALCHRHPDAFLQGRLQGGGLRPQPPRT